MLKRSLRNTERERLSGPAYWARKTCCFSLFVCASSRLMYGETSVLRGAGMVPHPISHSTQGSVDFFFFSHLVFLFKGRPISRSRPLGARWSYGRLASRCIGSGGGRRVCVHRTNISERAGHNRIHPVMHDICNNVGWGLSIAKCCSSLLSRPPLFLVFTNRSWVCGCFFFFTRGQPLHGFSFGFSLQFPCNLRCTATRRHRCRPCQRAPTTHLYRDGRSLEARSHI